MQILLLILKIIGIILLVLLCILILLILAVLFVPVRYRADGELLEEKKAHISAGWLLFVLRAACIIQNKEVTVRVRLFGFPVFSYPKQDKPEHDTKRRDRKHKMRRKKKETGEADTELEEEIRYLAESAPENKNVSKTLDISETANIPETANISKTADVAADTTVQPSEPAKTKAGTKSAKNRKKRSLKRILTKIWQKLKQIGKNLAHIKEMIYDEDNRSAFVHGCREIQYLLCHFGPRRSKMDLVFGTGDPARTGEVLGVICIFPVVYRNEIRIVPDFETDSFYIKGTFEVKGRVRVIHALLSGIRLWRDKNIRKLIHNIGK